MNEEIEYAKMLEIPVSTMQVVVPKRSGKRRKVKVETDEKAEAIAQVNQRIETIEKVDQTVQTYAVEGQKTEYPEREATFFLGENEHFEEGESGQETDFSTAFVEEKESLKRRKVERILSGVLKAEFALSGVLCLGIFLTNALLPTSAVNVFFAGLFDAEKADERTYSDFTLTSVVGDYQDVEFQLSESGVLSFTQKCLVYPAIDGTVQSVTRSSDGTYQVKITHNDSFCGVMTGLTNVYYAEGDAVYANVPVAYSEGETAVQVTMFWDGEILNDYTVTDENCLAWLRETEEK